MTGKTLITSAEIRHAFAARIAPVPTTWAYRLGLVAVLATMLALQALYVALVLAAGGVTAWWILNIPAIFSAVRINWFTILLVLGPPVAGAVVTFFLFKPIFVRPPKPALPPEVSREEQPELFEFLDKLCDCVGVRPPTRVALTLDVNASASLRRGWLSLFRNDLQLTIGLPLVSGLSLCQFTGVLAHEFGHFSQTAGLRSWFLIQSIRNWFARVAFERDQWDDKLAAWREESDGWRMRTVLGLANSAVEASRALLRVLLRIGGFVSSGFSRQMEFNADHFEASMVGADTFAETTLEMPAIEAAAQQSWHVLQQSWQARRLVDNFPRLVQHHRSVMADHTHTAIQEGVLAEVADRYATHPSPAARIANVRRHAHAGVFTLDGPAERLFRDFEGLCARVTEAHYGRALADEEAHCGRIPAEELAAELTEENEYAQAREALLPGAANAPLWFTLTGQPGRGSTDDEVYRAIRDRLLLQEGAVALLTVGVRINPGSFHLRLSDLDTARQAVVETRAELEDAERELRAAFGDVACLLAALAPNETVAAYAALVGVQPAILEIHSHLVCWRLLRNNVELLPAAEAANALEHESAAMDQLCSAILDQLQSVPSPIRFSQAQQTLGEQLRGTGTTEDSADWLLERAMLVGNRLLNRLCWQARRTVP